MEEIITSGRMNLNIDPVLHVWHWQIPIYLFLGGLAAGILFFAALYTIMDKADKYPTAVKVAPILVPFALVVGLFALLLDLKHKLYFWQLYTNIKFESPMSWGAWTLMAVTPLSIVWVASYLKELIPSIELNSGRFSGVLKMILRPIDNAAQVNWEWKFTFLTDFENYVIKERKSIAWIMIVLALILGVYTGILLSAFNARPLWNTSILGPLFLVSGLSTAAAAIMLLSKNKDERILFSRIDIMLIIIELFFIIHMFMGFLASTEVQIEAANLFLGGAYTVPFWGLVVVLGLLVPALLEILELRGYHVPILAPAGLILLGGLIFRFIMVEAGQITRYLY